MGDYGQYQPLEPWKRTTTDGWGRVTKVETGYFIYLQGSTTVSTVDTQYAPCACSPLGKLYRVSQPYAPGATPVWTTYTYDGSGRTLSVTAPDGSVTRYSYAGNQTTVTDPAGNWKTTTTDALGNLISVTEPNPAGGANFVTTYTYDGFNHLTNVIMTRPEGTQTRTFQYNGLDLVSATNPENGTVTYTYDASHKVLTRTDAKNQQTQYTYDQYGRVTQVLHGAVSSGAFTADSSQTWTFAYDTNIRLSQQNTYGRLAEVTIGSNQIYGSGITYEYSYSAGGRISGQKIHVEQILPQAIDFNLSYSWDVEGRLTAVRDGLVNYGSQIYGYEYQYDSVGRPNTMLEVTCLNGCTSPFATATYGPANEMTSLSYGSYNETRAYNNLLQLTRQTIPGVFDTEYVFPAGQNNGRIASSIDHISGDQVNYSYDALERLTHAETVSSAWGQTYAFDGFGNLTAKTVTKGSGSNWAQAYDPATNHMTGNPLITYDPNGNIIDQNLQQTYDIENHVTTETIDVGSTSHPTWYYDASGKRVVEIETLPNGNKQWTLYAYDISGHPYATLTGDSYNINVPTRNAYFGDRLIQSNGAWVVTDRLGSVRANSNGETFSYLPYGEERTATANSRIKFGTYFRDSTTYNQDYADQRYYNPWYGRFFSPDPYRGSMNLATPVSLNRYAYVLGDPVNSNDPTGLCIIEGKEYPDPCFATGSAPGTGTESGAGNMPGGGATTPSPTPPSSGYNGYCDPYVDWTCVPGSYGGITCSGVFIANATTCPDSPPLIGPTSSTPPTTQQGTPPSGSSGSDPTNPATPPTNVQRGSAFGSSVGRWAVWYFCGNSPQGAVENWMETGATKGAIGGAISGAGALGVASFGFGGVPGAAMGGLIGGVFGAGAGALWGGAAAAVCSYAGAYPHRSTP